MIVFAALFAPGGEDAFAALDRWEWAAGGVLLLLLLAAVRFFSRPRAAFAVEPGLFAPGARVRGTFLCERRPDDVRGVLELAREGGRPLRSAPANVGEPVKHDDGWRVPVSAVLPEDAWRAGDGSWTFSVEARSGRHALEASDEVLLADLWLRPAGPFAAGSAVSGRLYTDERPADLKVELQLFPDEGSEGEPSRRIAGTSGPASAAAGGWVTDVEARLPPDASAGPGAWFLHVEWDEGGETLEEDERVEVL